MAFLIQKFFLHIMKIVKVKGIAVLKREFLIYIDYYNGK